ncbi:hypothetical protein L9F63_003058, partial [Diploptera punctata]
PTIDRYGTTRNNKRKLKKLAKDISVALKILKCYRFSSKYMLYIKLSNRLRNRPEITVDKPK